ncbi:hypothetical protein DI392_15675 [Vibrio albus]|uniref:Beta-lactamase n=1 Tax=Vibrio albus TaxID=2200953 RepID=A0A2U3B6S3_9VIBR|nr:hypothetical protein [Vibrio albus]PWI32488.1 hypothetical protein DI392_15675 [Vibrio albus]
MKISVLSMLLVLGAFGAQGEELSLSWDWIVSAEAVSHRDTLYTEVKNDTGTDRINGLLDVEAGYGHWRGLFSLKGNNLYSSDEKEDPSSRFIVRELFWQGSGSIADTSLDMTVGKVRLDWGVGYGYRPLDIFKPYRRHPVGIQVEEGAGVASLSYFDSQGEWTLLYTNSSWTNESGSLLEEKTEQQGIGIRRYKLVGDHEYQWLLYYDDLRHSLVGGSVVSVLNDAWEVHASAVYQARFMGYAIQEDYEPVVLNEQKQAFQGLLGTTWANEAGHSVILEYWYDSRSWGEDEWNEAHQRVTSFSSDPGLNALRYSYAQGLTHANLMQHNLMLHWSLDSRWLNNLTPTLDLLYSPVDHGIIATQWLTYLMLDTGRSKAEMEVAGRYFGGDDSSVYARLPDDFMLLLNIKGKF